jgi:hypothetical protein
MSSSTCLRIPFPPHKAEWWPKTWKADSQDCSLCIEAPRNCPGFIYLWDDASTLAQKSYWANSVFFLRECIKNLGMRCGYACLGNSITEKDWKGDAQVLTQLPWVVDCGKLFYFLLYTLTCFLNVYSVHVHFYKQGRNFMKGETLSKNCCFKS